MRSIYIVKNSARQGDVYVIGINDIPKNYTEIKEDEKKGIILAHGEVTGHAHAIKNTYGIKMVASNEKTFLMAIKNFEVTHEEHYKFNMPFGNYRVIKQKEYIQKTEREVTD